MVTRLVFREAMCGGTRQDMSMALEEIRADHVQPSSAVKPATGGELWRRGCGSRRNGLAMASGQWRLAISHIGEQQTASAGPSEDWRCRGQRGSIGSNRRGV